MAKRIPLTYNCFLELENGEVKPWDEVTPEEKERFYKNARERLTRTMSRYYSNHPEELKRLMDSLDDDD